MSTTLERATVLVVHGDHEEACRARTILEAGQFAVITASSSKEALDAIFAQPPMCVLLEDSLTEAASRACLAELKADTIYGHLPVIAVVSEEEIAAGLDWFSLPADEYVVRPFTQHELVSRIRLMLARAQRDRHANPLTGLPGNPAIMAEAERRLRAGEPFAFAHADLDHFKAFNDRYGFARGDEIIRMTARLTVNTVKSLVTPDTYVGHIGGDDFVFIVPPAFVAETCDRLLRDFEQIVLNFYDEEDRQRGGIESVDRQGNAQRFPLMTISIGIVDTGATPVTHIGELCARVAEVKSFAKKVPGSNYLIDRRKREDKKTS